MFHAKKGEKNLPKMSALSESCHILGRLSCVYIIYQGCETQSISIDKEMFNSMTLRYGIDIEQ